MPWKKLCASSSLNLRTTLLSGQSFRWFKSAEDGLGNEIYTSILDGKIVSLKQSLLENAILYDSTLEIEKIRDYFQLDYNIHDLYEEWAQRDTHFKKKCMSSPGIRQLRIDPVECTFSFICSSNNNIKRITQMIEKLCKKYGQHVGVVGDNSLYSFPTIDSLCSPEVESTLRNLGFGYRAKYIAKSAKYLQENGGDDYLFHLRKVEYGEAKAKLRNLTGVGPKVADCILLMSLDKLDAVPIDTHVYQIAVRDYGMLSKKKVNMTDKIYSQVQERFNAIFGPKCGWAHTVLFSFEVNP